MAEEKKRSMIPVVIAVMLFVAGLVLGYYIWGMDRDKQVDYKKFLTETVNYIATLEHKNKKLLEEVDTLETEVNMLQQEQTSGTRHSEDQIDTLSQRISALEKENQGLSAAVDENKRLALENQELRSRVQALVDEMNAEKSGVAPIEPDTTEMPAGQPATQ